MTIMPGAVRVRLAELRKKRGLRQSDLATKAGISRATVINIERGNFGSIEVDTIKKICDALNVGIEDWMSYVPESDKGTASP